MKLYRHHLEKYNPETRDIQDNRRKISKAVFSYLSETGEEHRKAFIDKPYTSEMIFWNIAPKHMTI